jgi:cytoskeletal protein RodZ
MHDDPTRTMGQPDPGHRPPGNARLLVAGLIAVIAGLLVAIVVIASDGGNGESISTPSAITTESTTTAQSTTTEPSTETTSSTTTPTSAETTTTAPTTSGEEENGSGGIGVP